MGRKIRVKPSRPASLFGLIAGVIFVLIGITIAIPTFGLFGVFWTLCAVAITGFQAYSFFSPSGGATWEVDIDSEGNGPMDHPSTSEIRDDFETRLRKLNRLKEEGLISEEEFQRKREEILREKW